ncbi:MAG: asparagine synthase (glutamine-hydrolyzing) [Bacteroidota bacterium]
MCGISGIASPLDLDTSRRLLQKMTDRMAHRGPDGHGYFVEQGIALGHRRLSILDLSDAAAQPMTDPSGRYTMVYNGEVYNYEEIRAELPPQEFRSSGDTEVILAAFIAWGPACLKKLNGMFALAIWDAEEQSLFLARDRMGIKPLYYALKGEELIFGSEVRALLASERVAPRLNRRVLKTYLQYYTVFAPDTFLEGVQLLEAGHWAKFKGGKWHTEAYWNLAQEGLPTLTSDRQTHHKHIRDLLGQAVEKRMISDVPLGAFLSGGIDSSAIVGLMAQATEQEVHTFSVVFDEAQYDESTYSALIAKKFRTQHHTVKLTPEDFLHDLPAALEAMDHPSGDGLNSYVVSKAARQAGFTVALSGLGGDELFAGYPVFAQYRQIQRLAFWFLLPQGVRKQAAPVLARWVSPHKADRMKSLLSARSTKFQDLYGIFRRIFDREELSRLLVAADLNAHGAGDPLDFAGEALAQLPTYAQVSVGEISTYTQHVLLRDTDQMSMASSLEVRVPFFDHELVSYALKVPDDIKHPTYAKQLLVESLDDLLPSEVVHRKKMGFVFPWAVWLKGPLKPLCESHLQRLDQRGLFQPGVVIELWKSYLSGSLRSSWMKIWMLVILEDWLHRNQINTDYKIQESVSISREKQL